MLDQIASSCRYLLNNFPEAEPLRQYLNARLSSDSQETFQFGYFPNSANLDALTALTGEQVLFQEKLLYSREIEDAHSHRTLNFCYFENHPLIIPFKNAYGKTVALVGRTLLDEETRQKQKIAKYKNTIFSKGNYVFGLFENKQHILQQNCVYVVEGQFDVIKAVEKGFKNVVALGNANMTTYQFAMITRYTDNIKLLLDNDEAGTKGRKSIIEKFGKFKEIKIENAFLPPEYKDIDEYLNKNNLDDLLILLQN